MKKQQQQQQKQKPKDPFADEDDGSDDENKNVDLEEDFELLDEHAEFYKEYFEEDDDDAFYDRTGRIEKKTKVSE